MANAGNKNRSNRNVTGVRKNTSPRSSRNSGKSNSAQNENLRSDKDKEMMGTIATIVFVGLMILFFLCNFHLIGKLGDAISGFQFGVFGLLAYITPVLLVVFVFAFKHFKGNKDIIRRLAWGVVLYFLIAVICDLIGKAGVGLEKYSFSDLYVFGRDNRTGGGLLAGSLAYLIKSGLGTVGLVILLVIGIIVSLILITQRSFVGFFKSLLGDINEGIEMREARREQKLLEQQARNERTLRDRLNAPDDEEKNLPAEIPDTNEESGIRGKMLAQKDDSKAPEIELEYKPTVKELLAEKRNEAKLKADEQKRIKQEQREENKRLKQEQKETNDILKIVPPVNNAVQPTKYVNHEEVHEIYYEDYENNTDSNYVEQQSAPINIDSDYSTAINDTVRSNSVSDYDGIVGSSRKNPYERVSIPKQEIRSFHNVEQSEDYAPMNSSENIHYNLPDDSVDEISPIEEPEVRKVITPVEDAPVKAKPTAVPPGEDVRPDKKDTYYDNLSMIHGAPDYDRDEDAPAEPPKSIRERDNEPAEKVQQPAYNPNKKYIFPPIKLLKEGRGKRADGRNELEATKIKLHDTLESFGVNVDIKEAVQGPTVTRYEMTLEPGVKVSKILGLSDDIKLSLATSDIRIEAPIPGKSAVGIEVPNSENSAVALRDIIESREFKEASSSLSFAVGKNIGDENIVTDIAKMPHVLIAGTTGSGKSVCINTMIMSLIYKAPPQDVQMIMIDPKVVELSVYNGIPHLMLPVVTDPRKASAALAWAVKEMDNRYKKFADFNVRDLKGYNEKVESLPAPDPNHFKLPKIVIIIDELADLMMVCGKEVEEAICRLAQLARACGIHLVVATQRPSVDVITGLIKANMPSRIAFAVSNGTDSRTILDQVGAEKLLGKGDMLFYPQGKTKPERVQGAYVTDEEVAAVVDFLKNQRLGNAYAEAVGINTETLDNVGDSSKDNKNSSTSNETSDGRDELFAEAGRCIINSGKASIGYLQRMLKIGFNRAARIMDSLAEEGVVGPESGTKAREILMSIEDFEAFLDR